MKNTLILGILALFLISCSKENEECNCKLFEVEKKAFDVFTIKESKIDCKEKSSNDKLPNEDSWIECN